MIDSVAPIPFKACMKIIDNPHRSVGLDHPDLTPMPFPSTNAAAPRALLARCPSAAATPLHAADALAKQMGLGALWIKDERSRMGLGSFKALGAAYVLAHLAVETGGEDLSTALSGQTFVTASAGNHGLSVAGGAHVFGALAVIYLADTVPESFAERLRAKGAKVVREGAIYEASMEAAQKAAADNGWHLLSDSSWPGYSEMPHRLMEGYLAMADEAADEIKDAPTHIFLQAGVGGMAGAVAAMARAIWGDGPEIIVVEPEFAPALIASIQANAPVVSEGPASDMGRLDCKEPSLIALKGLARDADRFATISEEEAAEMMPLLAKHGFETSPSGGAGLVAAHLLAQQEDLKNARVLCFLSEGPA